MGKPVSPKPEFIPKGAAYRRMVDERLFKTYTLAHAATESLLTVPGLPSGQTTEAQCSKVIRKLRKR